MRRDYVKLGVYETLRAQCVDYGIRYSKISENMTLADFGFDSLDAIDISVAIDERYDIETDYETFTNGHTVGEIIDHIKKLIDAKV